MILFRRNRDLRFLSSISGESALSERKQFWSRDNEIKIFESRVCSSLVRSLQVIETLVKDGKRLATVVT